MQEAAFLYTKKEMPLVCKRSALYQEHALPFPHTNSGMFIIKKLFPLFFGLSKKI